MTICLPLFLAGGQGDRAFARYYPTVAVDGCPLRCAARATARHSGEPAASLVVTDIVADCGLGPVAGRRRLNAAGQAAVAETAARIAAQVDALLARRWSRRRGAFVPAESVAPGPGAPSAATPSAATPSAAATCSCGSGIPVQTVQIDGVAVTLVALPALLAQFRADGRPPTPETIADLLAQVRVYNQVPAAAGAAYTAMLQREYTQFWAEEHAP